jgi:hypothetical protein
MQINPENMQKLNLFPLVFVFISLSCLILQARNMRRPEDDSIPSITVCAQNQQQTFVLQNSYLRYKPIKNGFDFKYFDAHMIPEGTIEFRNKTGSIQGQTLSHLAELLLQELKAGKKSFTDFSILKDTDFSYATLSGLIVLKFKDYPFVIKLSMEHPDTIVQPLSKGTIAYFIFVIGGNLRHLSNFTRIPNLERIRNLLSYNPFYLRYLDFPRKWYWKPQHMEELKVVWQCKDQQETMLMPSTYAVISDFIEFEPNQPQRDLNKLSMKVATDTGFLIDPHSGNIVIEKGTRNYVLLDTEDFRMMVGLNRSMKSKKYSSWLIELTAKGAKTMLFRTKQERLEQTLLNVL